MRGERERGIERGIERDIERDIARDIERERVRNEHRCKQINQPTSQQAKERREIPLSFIHSTTVVVIVVVRQRHVEAEHINRYPPPHTRSASWKRNPQMAVGYAQVQRHAHTHTSNDERSNSNNGNNPQPMMKQMTNASSTGSHPKEAAA